ncbi:hypothetical protein H257_06660 [Aphanomyces astaci]|uniref:BTB domain-containing protein n=1 Tax=Aphanomyces astaci TaxID=112090 RepID=W4GKZ9_APHAT|nr:hypothetical protein H257_06660 [Aphanomyces astaci]ETV80352.1 hypothetical protein H257_06660 [Aphanomyces astaci]KAF0754655.1 hypothetical protein AaE_005245 [Aphanomyces astaci]|eukprot:XP_009830276.1 hypothetical protein H257_06660 [Aphanomyces astaci]
MERKPTSDNGSGGSSVVYGSTSATVYETFRNHRDLSRRLARFDFESPAPGTCWDVVLCVGGSRFHAHRFMLGMSSKPLNAMLTGHMRESSQTDVTLNDVTSATMSQLLKYIYSGNVDLSTDTVVQTLTAAEMYELQCLGELCKNFILQHAAHVFKPQLIEPLPEKLLCELIAQDDLQIRESALLDAVIAWGEARLDNVSSGVHGLQLVLADVVPLIRYPSMSVRELYCKVKPLVAASVIPEHYLTEALFFHLSWGSSVGHQDVRMRARTISTTMRKRKRVSFTQSVSFSEQPWGGGRDPPPNYSD